jgi:anti-sigma factor RsiW
MNRCENIRARIALYLDDELEGNERSALEAHLNGCEKCRTIFESERRFLEALRQTQPLHTAPPSLRAGVESILSNGEITAAAERRQWPGAQSFWNQGGQRRQLWPAVAIAAIAIVALPAVLWLLKSRQQSPSKTPSEFALMAADTHLRRVRGQLPLEITTDAPVEISEWFTNKVNFSVQLPHYQDSSGQQKLYSLHGARLVGYKGDYAAYVSYEMKNRPISLVITSETVAKPVGGEEIKSKGLIFHYDAIQGLKIITWSDRELTYALVSDLEERGQQSCVVCHQGTKDRDFIEPLKPR